MQKIPPGNRFTKLTQLASRAKRLIQPGDKQKTIKHLQNKTGCRIQNLDNSINTKIEMINKMEEVKIFLLQLQFIIPQLNLIWGTLIQVLFLM